MQKLSDSRKTNTTAGESQHLLVSILIPAYNAERWIGDTLRSALAQTWPHKEILVVDDGSTDRTTAVASQFAAQGVRVITQKNQGAAAARNHAYSLAKGEYIQWLDSDDLLAPDKIAQQMNEVQQGLSARLLLSGSFAVFKYRLARARFQPTPLWCDLSPAEWLLRKMGQNFYMQTGNWLVSRQLCDAAGPWDTRLLGDDDGEYFCRVLLASEGTRFVPGARAYYRCIGFTGLNYIGASERKADAQWLSMKLHIGYLRALASGERVNAACVHYLRTWLPCFYPEREAILAEARAMAEEFGGILGEPAISWKYRWLRQLFGWQVAKPVQRRLQQLRWTMLCRWDRLMLSLGRPQSP